MRSRYAGRERIFNWRRVVNSTVPVVTASRAARLTFLGC
jgi:hypothetical protein